MRQQLIHHLRNCWVCSFTYWILHHLVSKHQTYRGQMFSGTSRMDQCINVKLPLSLISIQENIAVKFPKYLEVNIISRVTYNSFEEHGGPSTTTQNTNWIVINKMKVSSSEVYNNFCQTRKNQMRQRILKLYYYVRCLITKISIVMSWKQTIMLSWSGNPG